MTSCTKISSNSAPKKRPKSVQQNPNDNASVIRTSQQSQRYNFYYRSEKRLNDKIEAKNKTDFYTNHLLPLTLVACKGRSEVTGLCCDCSAYRLSVAALHSPSSNKVGHVPTTNFLSGGWTAWLAGGRPGSLTTFVCKSTTVNNVVHLARNEANYKDLF